jgi:hypothetical protein
MVSHSLVIGYHGCDTQSGWRRILPEDKIRKEDESATGENTMKKTIRNKPAKTLPTAAGRALLRAGQAARKTARMHGTSIYIWRDGKVVAQKN